MNENEPSNGKEVLERGMPDEPALEYFGEAKDGESLYKMNLVDLMVYAAGMKAIKEESDDSE